MDDTTRSPLAPAGDPAGDADTRAAAVGDDVSASDGAEPSSHWTVLRELMPDLLRLLRVLAADKRVPLRAKLVAGAAAGYALLPLRGLPAVLPGTRIGPDDVAALLFAVRHLVTAAGFEVVREVWTGTDEGFNMLVVLAGVHR